MTPIETLDKLRQGDCPKCGFKITFFWFSSDKPWCKRCSVYYTVTGVNNEWVVANKCSEEEYNATHKRLPGSFGNPT